MAGCDEEKGVGCLGNDNFGREELNEEREKGKGMIHNNVHIIQGKRNKEGACVSLSQTQHTSLRLSQMGLNAGIKAAFREAALSRGERKS